MSLRDKLTNFIVRPTTKGEPERGGRRGSEGSREKVRMSDSKDRKI